MVYNIKDIKDIIQIISENPVDFKLLIEAKLVEEK